MKLVAILFAVLALSTTQFAVAGDPATGDSATGQTAGTGAGDQIVHKKKEHHMKDASKDPHKHHSKKAKDTHEADKTPE